MADGPSKNLSWDEMACKDGVPYPEDWRTNRAIMLSGVFELIRIRCGDVPIKILSCYRTESHNKSIGGAKNSQHVQGRAMDLRPPKGWDVDRFYKLIKGLATITNIGGIGKYLTFVHVDVRPTENVVYWSGNGTKDSLA